MTAKNVWLGNHSWPSNESCKQFAEDVFRIAGAKTDKEKAFAFYTWFTRCMMRGPNLMTPNGAGGYSRNYDVLPLLTSWGHGECTFWGWVAVECLVSAGEKVRRVVVHKQGHTYYEWWYKGDDGIEQWHAFDPFSAWYYLNENGEVASCEQIAANPQLAQNPLPGHPVPLGHHPERAGQAHRHRTVDQIFIDQPIRAKKNAWSLEKGMEVTVNFFPQAANLALFSDATMQSQRAEANMGQGSHCDIAEISKLGFQQQKENLPYWANYMWPTRDTDKLNEGRPVRWHGTGAIRWKPLQQDLSVANEHHNAVIENASLRPVAQHEFCEVWYHIQSPYLISHLTIDYDVKGAGDDYFGIYVSTDNKRTLWPMKMKSYAPHWGMTSNGQKQWLAGESSVQGLNELWIRVDMVSHHEDVQLAMQSLNITVEFQHNMHVQPRLLPKKNELWLRSEQADNKETVDATWIYQIDGEEKMQNLNQNERHAFNIDCEKPGDILMTGIQLRCR
ncbi:MAG: hypothetical protein HRU15_15425 [Planctomycetes bacterium]|nr:hypothetical protein [Planctomycetota bacterium]